MRAVVQRVSQASVKVNGQEIGRIGGGLVVLVGVANEDEEKDAQALADKIVQLRIFSDARGKLNLSALDIKGELLVVSQFTLLADTKKGHRPSFHLAAQPEKAQRLIELFIERLKGWGLKVESGRFGAYMLVEIHNDGPVTIFLDSKNRHQSSSLAL